MWLPRGGKGGGGTDWGFGVGRYYMQKGKTSSTIAQETISCDQP